MNRKLVFITLFAGVILLNPAPQIFGAAKENLYPWAFYFFALAAVSFFLPFWVNTKLLTKASRKEFWLWQVTKTFFLSLGLMTLALGVNEILWNIFPYKQWVWMGYFPILPGAAIAFVGSMLAIPMNSLQKHALQ